MLLEKIEKANDIKQLKEAELPVLAREIRETDEDVVIVFVTSRTL